MDISMRYAECDVEVVGKGHVAYNTAVFHSATADMVIAKDRKMHHPRAAEPFERKDATKQLEKRYFQPDLGFKAFRAPDLVQVTLKQGTAESDAEVEGNEIVWMTICNDRR